MILGVSSFAFGWAVGVPGHPPARPMTAFDLLDFARRHELGLVQFGDHIPLHEWSDMELDHLRQRAAIDPAIELEVGARGLTESHLGAYLRVARRLRSRLIRFVIDGPNYEPNLNAVATIIRASLPQLREHDITLGIENHDRFPVRELRDLIIDLDDSHVGICLDTANSLGAGEGFKEVLEALAPVTVNLHVKDFSIKRVPSAMGFIVSGQPAGQGMLNIPAMRSAVEVHGRCRTAVLESWTHPVRGLEDTILKEHDWAEQSIAFLKPLFP